MSSKLLVSSLLAIGVVSCASSNSVLAEEAQAKIPEESLQQDLALIRKTVVLRQTPLTTGSSGAACAAASRIFQRLQFVGMKKDHVLWVLGDPATISDAGVKAASGADSPLIYYFDGGFGGASYELQFEGGRVKKVTRSSID